MSRAATKRCSICGEVKLVDVFSYGNRDLRSYCFPCSKQEKAAYRQGGVIAARAFREAMRKRWRREA